MKKSLIILCAFLIGGLISNCQQKKENLTKIGVCAPLTGDQAKMGNDILNGVKLAVEEWNTKGGILGQRIEIATGDDRHDPKEAISVAHKMVNEGVIGVIGHFNSSCSIPASFVYHDASIPQISPASTNPQLTSQGFKNVFRTCGRDDQQGSIGAEFVINELRKKRIAVLHDKTTYGQGLADEFKKNIGKSNRASIVAYEGIVQGSGDYKAVLTKLKSRRPEVVYFGGVYPEGGLLVKQMRELGMKAIFVSGDGVIDPEFLRIAGDAALGTFLSFGPSVKEIPHARHFIESYEEKYGEIGPYSVYAYDAANILLSSIQSAGSTDGEKISEAIHNIRHEGALGTIQFNANGDVLVAPYIFWVVKKIKTEDGKEKLNFVPYT